ncbi:MAG: DUF2238 domain-containing protein [Euzebyaceae bacterium]|jgi:uncharacterized membrane protein YjdF|nr:DUF2238 domain-containing protein [Euzebyaceae bacterium]
MRLLITQRRMLAIFFVAYYTILLVYGAAAGAFQTIFYAVFVGGAALLVAQLYGKARFGPVVLWGLALWGLAHMAGGLVAIGGTVIYEHSLVGGEFRFDKIVHFFGFGFATLAAYELVRRTVGQNAPARSVAITAAFVGLGVGAVNETIEFLITLLPGDSNVGGFSNTGWDLVANALGAATAALMAPRLERHSGASVAPLGTARG